MDWWHARLWSSDHIAATPVDVQTWSFADQFEAHLTLDALEDIKAVHAWAQRPERK